VERFLKSRYRIGDQISENSFSATYTGTFLASNRPLIIKIYKRGALNSNLINGMKQKVKELSQINHHGIARLLDGDYGWQGFYYVREYVEGKSLAQILSGSDSLGFERTATLVEEICQSLALTHAKGIVHGGIKPTNIFIDTQGVVKLTDFVIEGEIKEAMPQKVLNLLDDGRYLAPEELLGEAASPLSDIYGVGMILLAGALHKNDVALAGLAGGLKRMRGPMINWPINFDKLPRYMQEIIARALQADPQLRFASVAELQQSLAAKMLVSNKKSHDEYSELFDKTVTQYGGEEKGKVQAAVEAIPEGLREMRWQKEDHRRWILALVLILSIVAGLVYAFLFGAN
jgi:serine/threonine-protein kinase